MRVVLWVLLPLALLGQSHRAEQDREISYWLLDPATHQFRISHDFNITKTGERLVALFARGVASIEVSPRGAIL